MSAISQLLTDHIDIWTAADTAKKSGRGRSSGNAASVYGIRKLRELILELAVRGKLVPQDANDEPASELLKRIQAEKAKLIVEGKIKKGKPLLPIADDQKPFELPQGWEWTTLASISLVNPRNSAEDNLPASFVPMTMIGTRFNSLHGQEARLWKEIKQGFTHFAESDIGVAKITPCFENSKACVFSGLLSGVGAGTTELHIVRPLNATLAPRFVLAYLKSPQFLLVGETRMTGTAGQKRLPKEFVESNPFPLPPLAEQHRIVTKVDELMALFDQLENQHNNAAVAHEKLVSQLLATLTLSQSAADFSANWQRIAAHFDTLFTTESSIDALKQTLLQLAVMGKLVPQDPNDEPASELLKRIQAEKSKLIAEGKIKKDKLLLPITDEEEPFALPHGWEWVRISDITSIRGGGTPSMAKSEYWGGKIPWVSPKDMYDGIIVDSELKITDKALKESNLELVPVGSILIVGRSGILKRKLPAQITAVPCTVNQDIKAVTPIKPLSDRYMQLIFWGNETEILARDVKQGTTVQSLVYENLFSRPFSLPPAAEQNRIIAKVDELMALCDHLKSRITAASQLQQKLADVMVAQAI